MIAKDRSITAWQTGIMMFVLLFANKILALPSLLYEKAKLESIFVPIVLFVLEMGIIFLFYRLKTKYPDSSFADICRNHFGKIVTICIYILFLVYFLSKAVLLYNFTYIFFRNSIYKDSSNLIYLFCFIPVVNHLAVSGLRVMGRTIQLFFPVIAIIALFCIVIGFFGITNIPLLYEGDIGSVFTSGLQHISSFGDSIFLFIIMDRIKIKKGQWKVVFSLSAISMVLISMVTIVFIFSYTYTSFMHPFALFEIMSYVKEYGNVGRIDIISMILIILFTYFQLAIYLKSFMISFKVIFPKISEVYSLLTFDIAFVLFINYLVLNLEKAVVYSELILPYFSVVAFIFVPFISLFLLFKRIKREAPK